MKEFGENAAKTARRENREREAEILTQINYNAKGNFKIPIIHPKLNTRRQSFL